MTTKIDFENCPYCDRHSIRGDLHCWRCGGRFQAVTPYERLLEHLQMLRVVVRNRSWSRMTDAAKSVQKARDAEPMLAPLIVFELTQLAQDYAQLLAPLNGADLVKIVTQGKPILALLPAELAAPLQTQCDTLNAFVATLAALEKQLKEKGAPAAEKLKAWLTPRAEKIGLSYNEAHACVYANPGRWPTLAGALDPLAFRAARFLANCSVGEKELREKNYGRAKKFFADVLARDAGFVRAWEGLGLTEAASKNMPEAIRCLREAVRLGTREPKTFNNLAWYLTTEGQPGPADLAEALGCALRAVELAPCEGFYDTLAQVYRRTQQWAEAFAAMRTAVRLNPERHDYRDKILQIAYDYEASKEEAAKTSTADESDAELSLDSGSEKLAGININGDSDSEFALSLESESPSGVAPAPAFESDDFDLSVASESVFEEEMDERPSQGAMAHSKVGQMVVLPTAEEAEAWGDGATRHSDVAPRRPLVEAVASVLAVEVAATVPPRPITDQVHFTVTSTRVLQPGEPTLIDVWAHLESQRKEMLVRAKEAQRDEEIASRSQGSVAIAQGSSISVQLKLAGFDVPEPESVILWQGDIGNTSFQVFVPENIRRGKHLGTVLFHISGLLIAKLNFDVVVGAGLTPGAPLPAQTTRCKTAFASYSSLDRDDVMGRIQGMQKMLPGLDVFVDVVVMRSGEDWDARLRNEIAKRDVFFLFWSANAKKSKEVEKEWRLALQVRGHDYIDPVPLAPPDLVPPPEELSSKHFNDWVLAFRRNKVVQEELERARQ